MSDVETSNLKIKKLVWLCLSGKERRTGGGKEEMEEFLGPKNSDPVCHSNLKLYMFTTPRGENMGKTKSNITSIVFVQKQGKGGKGREIQKGKKKKKAKIQTTIQVN